MLAAWRQLAARDRVLLGCVIALLALVVAADRHYALHAHPSDRFRMHALPVAVSYLYLGRDHDFTSSRSVAAAFHDRSNDLDDLLARYAAAHGNPNDGTYLWTADDRGLADFCALAFRLFGPRLAALSDLYLLLLGFSTALFVVGYHRHPILWLVPLLVLAGQLFLIHAYQIRSEVPLVDGSHWSEDIALYDSRVFEVLGALPWFHLALLAATRNGGRSAVVTGLPQGAILLLLLHARSTIGWEYLALATVAGGVLACRLIASLLGRPAVPGTGRALGVLVGIAASIAGLTAYQRATFHPAYFAERGGRTFWHNALIGFTAHPTLRARERLQIDDNSVLQWVIRTMRARGDSRCNPEWSTRAFCISAAGGETSFDWRQYEACAREVYFRTWRRHPGQALACHAIYKPKDSIGQIVQVFLLTLRPRTTAGGLLLGVGGLVVLGAVLLATLRARTDEDCRLGRVVLRLAALFTALAFVPCIAFYSSLATMSGVYLGAFLILGFGAIRFGQVSRSAGPRTDEMPPAAPCAP